ncbi:hypothetical protein CEXT_441891 [Caerostris extrusa]|uniref:Uncharacterized protein n=1 Tax=Caerostris extrusa TaxID=172846 RepID=A0AAV4RP92_CAEEX|nr:hypothetical protein CEXT_441891 [Caerostris extrusa]
MESTFSMTFRKHNCTCSKQVTSRGAQCSTKLSACTEPAPQQCLTGVFLSLQRAEGQGDIAQRSGPARFGAQPNMKGEGDGAGMETSRNLHIASTIPLFRIPDENGSFLTDRAQGWWGAEAGEF